MPDWMYARHAHLPKCRRGEHWLQARWAKTEGLHELVCFITLHLQNRSTCSDVDTNIPQLLLGATLESEQGRAQIQSRAPFHHSYKN